MILDPFYGVNKFETEVARWLNRLVLTAEISALLALPYLQYKHSCFRFLSVPIDHIALFFLCLVAMWLVNVLLRKLCNVVLVIRYGTTDAEVIYNSIQEKKAKREERKSAGKKPELIVEHPVYMDIRQLQTASEHGARSGSRRPIAKLYPVEDAQILD